MNDERKTLDRELARAKVTANRVAVVVANEWKNANDKVMPVKQWLEERRFLQGEMQQLRDSSNHGTTVFIKEITILSIEVIPTPKKLFYLLDMQFHLLLLEKAGGRLESNGKVEEHGHAITDLCIVLDALLVVVAIRRQVSSL